MTLKPLFWVMVWVFAVQHPGGAVTERAEFYKNRMPFMECDAKTKAMTKFIGDGKHLTEDGGDAIYSRFLCVPVPPPNAT